MSLHTGLGMEVQKRDDWTFIGVVVREDDDPAFVWVAWGMRKGDPIHGDDGHRRERIARAKLRQYPPVGDE